MKTTAGGVSDEQCLLAFPHHNAHAIRPASTPAASPAVKAGEGSLVCHLLAFLPAAQTSAMFFSIRLTPLDHGSAECLRSTAIPPPHCLPGVAQADTADIKRQQGHLSHLLQGWLEYAGDELFTQAIKKSGACA